MPLNSIFSNLLGSNIFNILILAVDDFAYTREPLFISASDTHVMTSYSAVMMTGLVALALMKPPQKKVLNIISSLSVLILLMYLVNLFISFVGEN